jgi:hypothetical protein
MPTSSRTVSARPDATRRVDRRRLARVASHLSCEGHAEISDVALRRFSSTAGLADALDLSTVPRDFPSISRRWTTADVP